MLFEDFYDPSLFISGAVHEEAWSPQHEGTPCGSADGAPGSTSTPVTPVSSTGEAEVPAIKLVSCSRQERELACNRSKFCLKIYHS